MKKTYHSISSKDVSVKEKVDDKIVTMEYSFVRFTFEEVNEYIKNIKCAKSPGLDNIYGLSMFYQVNF